jgi:hypothetical protein
VNAIAAGETGAVLVGTAAGEVVEILPAGTGRRWSLETGEVVELVVPADAAPAGSDGSEAPGRDQPPVFARARGGALYALGGDGGVARVPTGDSPIVAMEPRRGGGLLLLDRSGALLGLELTAGGPEPAVSRIAAPTAAVGRQEALPAMTASSGGAVVVTGPGWTVAAYDLSQRAAAAVADGPAGVATPARDGELDRIYLSRMLGSPDPADQRRGLEEIAGRIEEVDLAGSYTRVVAVLLEFVRREGGGGAGSAGVPGAAGRAGIAERARAVRLLARIGGYGVRDALVSLARRSEEREIRLAVLHAVADLPADGEGRTARMILTVLREEARRGADSRLGTAALAAIRGYVSYRGGVDDAAIGEAIGILVTGGFPRGITTEVSALARELY